MSRKLYRRGFLACGASAVMTGCAARRSQTPARVSIVRAAYDDKLYDVLRRLVADHRVRVAGKRVVLKPNLVEFDEKTAINTSPFFVHAALEAFRAAGAADVRIAEGPGHRRDTFAMAEAAGYFDRIPGFERLFTDLNLDEVDRVSLPGRASGLGSLYLSKTALGADLLVSLPKMKTHHWAGVTLSLKNLFGVVPGGVYGWPKNVLHWAGINECVADLGERVRPGFAIVDGIVAMEGNGPIQGTPKAMGVVVAGADPVAVDATCCRIMGVDPEKVVYLEMAAPYGQTRDNLITQSGETAASVRSSFQLPPGLGHIGA